VDRSAGRFIQHVLEGVFFFFYWWVSCGPDMENKVILSFEVLWI
jgi:hypothetical protein